MGGYTTSVITEILTGRTSVDDAAEAIATTHNNFASIWAAHVADWIKLNYPDRV